MQLVAGEGIQDNDLACVGGEKEEFTIIAELKSCPLNPRHILTNVERSKRTFIKALEIIQLHHTGVNPSPKYESFRVEPGNWSTIEVHDPLTTAGPEVPQSNCLVQ
jgi:hypothetical protein